MQLTFNVAAEVNLYIRFAAITGLCILSCPSLPPLSERRCRWAPEISLNLSHLLPPILLVEGSGSAYLVTGHAKLLSDSQNNILNQLLTCLGELGLGLFPPPDLLSGLINCSCFDR